MSKRPVQDSREWWREVAQGLAAGTHKRRRETSLRDELVEIIRWRFTSADGRPLDGSVVLKRAQEIADEIAPMIEDALQW